MDDDKDAPVEGANAMLKIAMQLLEKTVVKNSNLLEDDKRDNQDD